jgi:hypothetical protein
MKIRRKSDHSDVREAQPFNVAEHKYGWKVDGRQGIHYLYLRADWELVPEPMWVSAKVGGVTLDSGIKFYNGAKLTLPPTLRIVLSADGSATLEMLGE